MSLSTELEQRLGVQASKQLDDFTYDDWLDYFRRVPRTRIIQEKDWLSNNLWGEGYAAAARWIEIFANPSKMDKLYQGRLNAKSRESIMELAVGDDDEAFYEALIRENVAKLDESRNSAQEVARITQNLNIFRQELREIRSRKPKKGTVLEKVLELSAQPPKPAKAVKKAPKKASSKTKSKEKKK